MELLRDDRCATPAGRRSEAPGIVGESRAIKDLIRRIEVVSGSRSTVLVTGETGTGKELVARAIHGRSAQRHMPFVRVNCAAIPETLLESELFGHVRGAFTDASRTRRGRFALANGGSIFLDEIGATGPGLQSKLLRVLQEREIDPLGAEHTERVDVRVVAATNRDLRQLVDAGRFAEDLYFRLNVIPIVVPPLRDRIEDIPMLAAHFIEKHAAHCGRRIDGLEDGVLAALQDHDWPGNVRELENVIERGIVFATGHRISRAAISLEWPAGVHARDTSSLRLRENVEWMECHTIRRALENSPVKRQAAELLGISQRALSYYLGKYPFIEGEDPRRSVRGARPRQFGSSGP